MHRLEFPFKGGPGREQREAILRQAQEREDQGQRPREDYQELGESLPFKVNPSLVPSP